MRRARREATAIENDGDGGQKTEGSLSPVCYRGGSDDPRSRRQDEPRSEGSANYCTTNCTLGIVSGRSLKIIGKINTVRWPSGRVAEGGGLLKAIGDPRTGLKLTISGPFF